MVAGSCTAFQVLTHVALLKQALQAWGQGGRWGRVFGLLKAKHRGGNRCPSVAVPSDLLSSTVIPGALSKSPSRPCEAPLPLCQLRTRSRIPRCPTSKRKIEQHLLYASAPPRGAWPRPPRNHRRLDFDPAGLEITGFRAPRHRGLRPGPQEIGPSGLNRKPGKTNHHTRPQYHLEDQRAGLSLFRELEKLGGLRPGTAPAPLRTGDGSGLQGQALCCGSRS